MKKQYDKPAMLVIEMQGASLLAGSVEGTNLDDLGSGSSDSKPKGFIRGFDVWGEDEE